jgi:hypothetical protein
VAVDRCREVRARVDPAVVPGPNHALTLQEGELDLDLIAQGLVLCE